MANLFQAQGGQHPQIIQIDSQTKVIGQGNFGAVYEYVFNGMKVAVKRIQQIDLNDVNEREVNAMSQLSHPNVLGFIAQQQDKHFTYLVLELCLGTIADYIQGKYTDQMPSEINGLIQMASGLQYIHSQKFVHRDIKPANVLISFTRILKISDFGFCKAVSASGNFSVSRSGPKGTHNYMAPEYLELEDKTEEERQKIRANISIDIFSLGCVFFTYIKRGGHLFQEPGKKGTLIIPVNITKNKKFLDQIEHTHYAYQLIDDMTQANPQNRLGLEQVIEALNLQLQHQ